MLNPTTQAILLLTAHFSKADDKDTRPLTTKEWAVFASWLHEHGLRPEQLLTGDISLLLRGWMHKRVTPERLHKLLSRATGLGLALEKWTRAGLWVLTRSDAAYPKRLKQRLGNEAPPVLFGCGKQEILNQGGIAVIGSRNADDRDVQRSQALGAAAASAALPLVSGGARGVDESAMLGSLLAEGRALGVLSCDLLKTAMSARYRRYLMKNELVLISPFYPEAGFNVGNAMQRNKYVYCLADTAIVVHSGTKGGTWEGALENLKYKWVPLWVLPNDDSASGNAAFIGKGARWLQGDVGRVDLRRLLEEDIESGSIAPPVSSQLVAEPGWDKREEEERAESMDTSVPSTSVAVQQRNAATADPANPQGSLYDCFLSLLERHTMDSPLKLAELEQVLQIQKTQLNIWIKQAMAEGKVKELTQPKRYQWNSTVQDELFERRETSQ
jgi:predicted Rossmann fold nucleotide-binding protein DprA/Smf involved in DNA uptake